MNHVFPDRQVHVSAGLLQPLREGESVGEKDKMFIAPDDVVCAVER